MGLREAGAYIQFICFILISFRLRVQVLRAVHKLTAVFLVRGTFVQECSL